MQPELAKTQIEVDAMIVRIKTSSGDNFDIELEADDTVVSCVFSNSEL